MGKDLIELLESEPAAAEFCPYCDLSPEADALTVYFRPDADYSKRLTDHVTLYLSQENDEVVGCRIKGISGLIADLPNYIQVKHEETQLSLIFWSFRGCATNDIEREALNELARGAGGMTLSI